MNSYIKNIIIISSIFLFSCETKKVNERALAQYFETQRIIITNSNSTATIIVKQSNLIEKNVSRVNSDRAYLEQYASAGALISFEELKYSKSISYVVMKLVTTKGTFTFTYKFSDLLQIRKYIDLCNAFIHEAKNRNAEKYRMFLENDLQNHFSNREFDAFINEIIRPFEFINAKPAAFKIVSNKIVVFFNLYYNKHEPTTCIFGFTLNGSSKISSIEAP